MKIKSNKISIKNPLEISYFSLKFYIKRLCLSIQIKNLNLLLLF